MVFDSGEPVTYRELWGGRIMTAVPMRVVTDSESSTALYLAAETSFWAARAPGGGAVRDLEDWISVPATWTGGSLIRLLRRNSWHSIDLEFGAGRELSGFYVNFQKPVQRTKFGFDTVDLVIDLEVAPDGTTRLKDLEDFEDAVKAGHIPIEVAERVWADVDHICHVVATNGAPEDTDQWIRWRPPESWDIPKLADGWENIHA